MKLLSILLKMLYQNCKALFRFSLILIIVSPINNHGQDFETSPFILMPGNNTNIDVLNVVGDFNPEGYLSYICWINNTDSNYTIYLKRTSPNASDNTKIFSDTSIILNPKVAFGREGLRIVWQMEVNGHWQILSRELIGDSLTNIISVTDSLSDNITPTISTSFIAWINNGNLFYQYFDSLTTKPRLLDSIYCSNPELSKFFNSTQQFDIVYEKGADFKKQIYLTKYYYARKPYWTYEKISGGSNNINPHFNFGNACVGCLSYQSLINDKWKIIGTDSFSYDTTSNISFNCENPIGYFYSYETTKMASAYTPSFIVYDADSLKSNKEIFLETKQHYTYPPDTLLNISNSGGDDYLPHILFYRPLDTLYIAVIWIHEESGKKDIWMSKSVYNPLVVGIHNRPPQIETFALYQNYPNPFNPSTTISFSLPKQSFVTLKVFDCLGREIKTLIAGELSAGRHSYVWNAAELAGGVYLLQILTSFGNLVRKAIYLK